jgi:hypothetical protein
VFHYRIAKEKRKERKALPIKGKPGKPLAAAAITDVSPPPPREPG